MNEGATQQADHGVGAVTARHWNAAVLLCAIVLALFTALFSVLVAGAIIPLGDLTPVVVLGTAAISRRWGDYARTAMRAASVLAAVMLIEMLMGIPVLLAMMDSTAPWAQLLRENGAVFWVYPAQLIVLLVCFGYASTRRALGIFRATSAMPVGADG
jgi:hypothetical protein